MTAFRQHGTYTIELDGDTIIVDAKGPFNVEGVQNYHDDLKRSIELIAEQYDEWNQIIVLHEESLFTPDAADRLTESNRWRAGLGLKRCAIVLVNPIGSKLIKRQLNVIYGNAGVSAEIFESMSAAKQWLAS